MVSTFPFLGKAFILACLWCKSGQQILSILAYVMEIDILMPGFLISLVRCSVQLSVMTYSLCWRCSGMVGFSTFPSLLN